MFSGGDDKNKFLRYKDGKKSLGLDDARKRREDKTISMRTARRDELLAKKRREPDDYPSSAGGLALQGGDSLPEAPLDILTLTELVKSPHFEHQLQGTAGFRKLLAQDQDPPIDQVTTIQDHIVVRRLVEFLRNDMTPKLQFEAAWVLTNIASGTSDHARILIDHHAEGEFLRLVGSPDADVQEQVVWALGNIAGDCHQFRDHLLSIGALRPLLHLAQQNPPDGLQRLVVWTISNLCRGKPAPPLSVLMPALPVLAELIRHPDPVVVIDGCWAFQYVTEASADRIDAVLQLGILPRLVEIISSPNIMSAEGTKLATPAVRIIGNFVTGTDTQTDLVLSSGALIPLRQLLSHPQPTMRKEACWTISNITAGSPTQVQAVVDAGIIPPVITNLAATDAHVRREAVWAVANATTTSTHVPLLVANGVIEALVDMLKVNITRQLQIALEALDNILAAGYSPTEVNQNAVRVSDCGGILVLERLEHHRNPSVKAKVKHILTQYFENPDDDGPDNIIDGDDLGAADMGPPPAGISFA